MERMTRTTVATVKTADDYGFQTVDGGVMVWLNKNGTRTYACGASGPLIYSDAKKARRNIQKQRHDFEPTYTVASL